MNTKPTTETTETADVLAGDDDQVVVEELFIEEYQLPVQPIAKKQERRSALSRVRSHPKSAIGSMLAFGALVMASLFAGRRRKVSMLTRMARKVGIPV